MPSRLFPNDPFQCIRSYCRRTAGHDGPHSESKGWPEQVRWVEEVLSTPPNVDAPLMLKAPTEASALLALCTWARKRGITLQLTFPRVEPDYPRECRNGHAIKSSDDEYHRYVGERRYHQRQCRQCRRAWHEGNGDA